ncbi:MAG TPA: hypothetical protein VGR25_02450 [bacterium]|jgi:SAM-dependent methyltransferase|nr:hypothetical protein [bacterium]
MRRRSSSTLHRGADPDEAELRQRALALWLPERAAEVLCVIYGDSRLPLVLAEGARIVYLSGWDGAWARGVRDEASARGWQAIRLLPNEGSLPLARGTLDVGVVLALPLTTLREPRLAEVSGFIQRIRESYEALRPGGILVVGWETPAGLLASGAGARRVWPAARWSRAVGAGVRAALPSLEPRRSELIHVYPNLWRPVLLAPRRASARLKRLALGHAGRLRWPAVTRMLSPWGRIFLPDLLPTAVLWRLEK